MVQRRSRLRMQPRQRGGKEANPSVCSPASVKTEAKEKQSADAAKGKTFSSEGEKQS